MVDKNLELEKNEENQLETVDGRLEQLTIDEKIDRLLNEHNTESADVIPQIKAEVLSLRVAGESESTPEGKAEIEEFGKRAERAEADILADTDDFKKSAKEIMEMPDSPVDASLSTETNTFEAPASAEGVVDIVPPPPIPEVAPLEPDFAIDNISRTPVEAVGTATGVGLDTSDVQPAVVVEKTPLTEAEWLKQADKILETSDEALERSKSAFGKPKSEAEDQLKNTFARVSPMAMNGIINGTETISKESQKEAAEDLNKPKTTRIESISSDVYAKNLGEIVDDTTEEKREALSELTQAVENFKNNTPEVKPENKPKVESGKSRLDKLMDAIGNTKMTKYAIDAVPKESYETAEERKARVAYERHLVETSPAMEVQRDRKIFAPVQKWIDRFTVNQVENRKKEASKSLSSLTKMLEDDTRRTVEIDEELLVAKEKIKQLANDPILSPDDRLKQQEKFEAQAASLLAEQNVLKSSIETAAKDHRWVKGQMESLEIFSGKIVEKITKRNDKRLHSLDNELDGINTEIANLKAEIREHQEYIHKNDSDKEQEMRDGTLKVKDLKGYEKRNKRAKASIDDLLEQLNVYREKEGSLKTKKHDIEVKSNKFKRLSATKPSEQYEDLETIPPEASVSAPAPAVEVISNTPPSSDYETTDTDNWSETEAKMPEPEIVQEKPVFRTTPNPIAGDEIVESQSKGPGQELFPEAPKPKTPENPVSVVPAPAELKQTPSVSPQSEVVPVVAIPTENPREKKSLKDQVIENRENKGSSAKRAMKLFERIRIKAGKNGFRFIKGNLGADLFNKYNWFLNREIKTPKEASDLAKLNKGLRGKMATYIEKRKKSDEKNKRETGKETDTNITQRKDTEKYKKEENSEKEKRAGRIVANNAHKSS